jgi:hypothetical protein
MNTERTETVWLDAHCEVSFAELAQLSGPAVFDAVQRSSASRMF